MILLERRGGGEMFMRCCVGTVHVLLALRLTAEMSAQNYYRDSRLYCSSHGEIYTGWLVAKL